jgi:hypothetical protein
MARLLENPCPSPKSRVTDQSSLEPTSPVELLTLFELVSEDMTVITHCTIYSTKEVGTLTTLTSMTSHEGMSLGIRNSGSGSDSSNSTITVLPTNTLVLTSTIGEHNNRLSGIKQSINNSNSTARNRHRLFTPCPTIRTDARLTASHNNTLPLLKAGLAMQYLIHLESPFGKSK